MLRRILLPFSEIFIVLMMIFFSFLFVSAALSGRGEDRPVDDIFILSISTKQFFLPPPPIIEDQDPIWMHRSDGHLAATDPEGYKDDVWVNAWMNGLFASSSLQIRSIGEPGNCLSAQTRLYNHDNLRPTDDNRPEAAFNRLAGSGSKLTATTSIEIESAPERAGVMQPFQGQQLTPPQGIDIPNVIQPPSVTHKLSITYRPVDIQQNVIIEVGVINFYGSLSDSITILREKIPEGSFSRTELVFRPSPALPVQAGQGALEPPIYEWLAVLIQDGQELQEAPIYHRSPGCDAMGAQSARLYVILTPDGADILTHPPSGEAI